MVEGEECVCRCGERKREGGRARSREGERKREGERELFLETCLSVKSSATCPAHAVDLNPMVAVD